MSVCAGCAQENPAAARFCLSCGRLYRSVGARSLTREAEALLAAPA